MAIADQALDIIQAWGEAFLSKRVGLACRFRMRKRRRFSFDEIYEFITMNSFKGNI